MRLIKRMADYIEDEVCGSIDYAKDALEYQYDKPALAKMFFQMAQTEYGHYQALHEMVVKLIQEIKDNGRTVPTGMEEKWEEKHKHLIAKAEEAQVYMNMFNK